jgi:type II secretory pathway pseudopilin PulG
MRACGYALIESLLASVILATGLLVAVSVFCVSSAASFHNRQRTIALTLAREKMEELRHSTASGTLQVGGSIDPLHAVPGYREFIRIDATNPPSVGVSPSQATHLRLWEIRRAGLQTLTTAVFEWRSPRTPVELARISSAW